MSNELLFFITLFCSFVGVVLFYRLFGKVGMYCWMVFATVVANIEASKCVDMFGLSVTLGNVLFSSNFLCTDILHEKHGGKTARGAVWISFAALLVFVGLEQLTILFKPNEYDFVDSSMKVIFGFLPRMCAASAFTFLCSNMLDTYLYGWWSKRTTRVWVRNNGSTLVSQAVDSVVFSILAFAGVMPWIAVWEMALTTYAIKVLVALLDTPFIYVAKRMKSPKFNLNIE